jgi:hypothetical protein
MVNPQMVSSKCLKKSTSSGPPGKRHVSRGVTNDRTKKFISRIYG